MKMSRNWMKGVSVKNTRQISQTKKAKPTKSNQKEDICLSCKELKCNKGICNKFKK